MSDTSSATPRETLPVSTTSSTTAGSAAVMRSAIPRSPCVRSLVTMAPVDDDHLQEHEAQAEQQVESDNRNGAGPAQALEHRVAHSLNRERRDAEPECEPDREGPADDAERTED